ncbi:MAG: RsmD family RNA methyltransferase, partial [Pseudomonadota bacterium]|nr:RsmD family RNA methyltransferase [Pseudomonadota bacterium]
TRPTSDRAREGLFSMLQSRVGNFEGLNVADLFAGTGSLGLEALSRGAAHCTFVETNRDALAILRRNIQRLGAAARCEVKAQAVEHVPPPPSPFDLVFIDPPYDSGLAQVALDRAGEWLVPGAWVSIEVSREPLSLPPDLEREAERRYG